jgi:hypothetical protein
VACVEDTISGETQPTKSSGLDTTSLLEVTRSDVLAIVGLVCGTEGENGIQVAGYRESQGLVCRDIKSAKAPTEIKLQS